VNRIAAAYTGPRLQTSPLFNRRSLFRNADNVSERRA
jgi:hypothetical protein